MDGYVVEGEGLSISDVRLGSARYGITMRRKDGSYGTATNLTIRRVDITASEAPIYIRSSHDILIEDARLTCNGAKNNVPGGVKVGYKGSDPSYNIHLNRVLVQGCRSVGADYEQGDGLASERPDHDILIENSTFRDLGDGCIDTKSTAVRLSNVVLDGCNYGLRAWGQGEASELHVVSVRKAAIQTKAETDWAIHGLYLPAEVPSSGDVFADVAGGRLAIDHCSRPLVLKRKTGVTLTLDASCRP